MKFEKAMKIWQRICSQHRDKCASCPLAIVTEMGRPSCGRLLMEYPQKAQQVLEDWEKAHPPRTILDDFKEKYPNAKMNRFGVPDYSRPCELGYMSKKYDCSKGCRECWHTPIEDEPKQEAENYVAAD